MLMLLAILAVDTTHTVRVAVAASESLRVVSTGAGEPVIMLPGLIGSAFGLRHLADSIVADGRRAVVIEPLGIGGSSRPRNADYSLTAQADRIAAVMDSLDLGPAVVVAHSMGGSVALRLAYRRPELVGGLLLLEGGPAEAATGRRFRRLMALAPLLKRVAGPEAIFYHYRRELREVSANPAWVTETVIHGYAAEAMRNPEATLSAFQGIARSSEPEALRGNLARIRCPVVLLLGGTPHSGRTPEQEVAILRAEVPQFRVVVVENAGHFIHEEQPGAAAAAVRALDLEVRRWLGAGSAVPRSW
ncbi:MAG TPA: alpha/beta fold hydrolase [Gemmatimonadales bacterium]|nr:alpha/beta fold hydrolase [Gemmatimonadales bacterium]